jgi:hypothetical protein
MVMLTEKGKPIELANFGTWSVDEATKTLSYHVESAFVPKSAVVQYGEGSENKFPISLIGDELKYYGATLEEVVWHRHGPAFVQPVSQTSVAQQKSLKEQLVGTWILVSCEDKAADGKTEPRCVNPNGSLSFDASGRYTRVEAARGRPKVTAGRDSPAEEIKTMVRGFLANFGTWSVNEADKFITRHREGALFPNAEGMADRKQMADIVGDELMLVDANPQYGVEVWRRAK